jgi:hypothetical protein
VELLATAGVEEVGEAKAFFDALREARDRRIGQ